MIGCEYQQPFPLRMIAYSASKQGELDLARSFLTESLRSNQKVELQAGILAYLITFADVELVMQNFSLSTKLYKYVNGQLQKQKLQLIEPDEAARKRVGKVVENGVDDKFQNQTFSEFNQLLQEMDL